MEEGDPIYTLVGKLNLLNKAVIVWEGRMKHDQGCELALIEDNIVDLFLFVPTGVLSADEVGLLVELKVCKVALLVFVASS